MYTTLLWATDGSLECDHSLDTALALLEPRGHLIAYHCDQRFLGRGTGSAPMHPDSNSSGSGDCTLRSRPCVRAVSTRSFESNPRWIRRRPRSPQQRVMLVLTRSSAGRGRCTACAPS